MYFMSSVHYKANAGLGPLSSTFNRSSSIQPLHRIFSDGLLILASLPLLLVWVLLVHCRDASVPDDILKTDLTVDLAHPLLISGCNTNRAEQDVHLLQGQTFGLGHEEGDEEGTAKGKQTEEDVGAVPHARKHVGGNLTNDEIAGSR